MAKKNQTTEEHHPLPVRTLYRFLFRLGALSFFIWLGLTLLQSVIWGSYLLDLSEAMAQKVEFLKANGAQASPSLMYFVNAGLVDILGAGSLYGFFYLSLPQALLFALGESVIVEFKRRELRIISRGLIQVLYWLVFYSLISAYADGVLLYAWAALVAIFLPLLVSRGLEKTSELWEEKGSKLTLLYGCLALGWLVLPFVTNPILDSQLRKEKYEHIESLTLLRDWVLLDEEGQNLINEWYYRFSPYAAEYSGVTVFQPLLIGVCQVRMDLWQNYLRYGFPKKKGENGDRVQFVKTDDFYKAMEWLKSGKIKILFCDSEIKGFNDQVVKDVSEEDLFFLANRGRAGKALKRFSLLTRQEFFGDPVPWGAKKLRSTPVMRKVIDLRKSGFDEKQTAEIKKYQTLCSKWTTSLYSLLAVLIPAFIGAGLYFIIWLSLAGGRSIWILAIVALLFSPWVITSVVSNVKAWMELYDEPPGYQTPEARLKQYHYTYRILDQVTIDDILSRPLSEDSRLAMWEVQVLGRYYNHTTEVYKEKIVQYLKKNARNYLQGTINYRYKFLASISRIKALRPEMEKLSRQEKHLYVRWYAESFGYGTRPMDSYEKDQIREEFWQE